MRKLFAILAVSSMLYVPVVASAALWQPIVPKDCVVDDQGHTQKGGCQSICDVAQLVQNILNDAVILSTFLAAILFAWAGGRMVTAGGNSHVIDSANNTFNAVFIGFIIILLAWVIVDTIMKTFTDSSFGPWNQICVAAPSAFGPR